MDNPDPAIVVVPDTAEDVDVVVAPPFTSLKMVSEIAKDSYIGVSAQNVHHEEKGAYTGEIAASFIKDSGATYNILVSPDLISSITIFTCVFDKEELST